MRPEEGQLAGHIEQPGDGAFQLTDFSGKNWRILYDTSTFIPPIVLLEKGERVKIVGTMMSEDRFRAAEIRPWQGPGRQRQGAGRGFPE
jgi:hypothetical protein